MTDTVTLGLRFEADQRDLQAASDKGVENIRRIGEAGKKSNEEAARAAQQHTDALRRQADTLGMSRSQVLAYEAAQHKMNDAQRQSAAASISAIDAYEKKTAMLSRVRFAAVSAGTALGVAFVAGAKASVAAAAESEQAQLRLEAVLRGTGYAAGFNGDQLDRMAGRMQTKLGINDETIKKSMATLLTFRQVGRDSFEDALNVAANIAAVMGTDLQSATLQLGKALEDPEQGLTALTRSGVTFNDTQKAMIKDMVQTGRTAEAITEILRVMKSQGLDKVQESMHTGITGAGNEAANAWDDFLESIGKTPAVGGLVESSLRGVANVLNEIRLISEKGNSSDQMLGILAATRGPAVARIRAEQAAMESQDARELRRGGVGQSIADIDEQKRVQAAADQAGNYLKQFRSDNQKLEDELTKWNQLADKANYTTQQRVAGEAAIRAHLAKKGSQDSKEGAQLITSLTDQLQNASGEASAFDTVMRKVTDGTHKFTEAEIAAALAIAGEIDERKRARKEIDEGVAAYDRDEVKRKASAAAIAGLNESINQQAQGLQLEIDMMGASDAQREKAIALRELENKFIKARIGLDGEALAQSYEMERVERDRIAGLLDQRGAAQERKKAHEEAKAEQKRFKDDIERGLTDSIFRGFEGGKPFARNFWDSMKNMAKTTVLQPVVKFLVSPITGALTAAMGSLGIPGIANAAGGGASGAGGLGGLGSLGGMGSLSGWVTNSGGITGMAGALTGGFDAIFQNAGVGMGSQFVADIGNYGLGMPVIGGLAQMLMGNVKGGVGSMIGGGIGSMFGPLGTMAGSAIGSMLGSALGGKKGGPASFTGLDVSGTANMRGLTSSNWVGNSTNSKQAFSWQSFDHGATGGMNAMIQSAFADISKVAKALGLDSSRLNNAQFGFSFRSTGTGTGAGPTTQEVIDSFGQSIGQLTDQMAETLMPNIREFAQANETLTQTLVRLADARRAADLEKVFGGMQGALQLADQTRDLWLSDLSPLTAKQRLDESQGRYSETLAKAQGGDLGAMGQLSGMARTYLGEARGYYASSADYTGIFGDVQAQIGGLVEDTLVEQSIAFSEMGIPLEKISENTKDLDKRIAAALAAAIEASGAASDAAVRAQTADLIKANQDLAATLKSFVDARVLA